MDISFSTSDVHPRHRFDYMREVACRVFVDLDCRTDVVSPFHATIRSGQMSELGVTIVETDACEVTRTRRNIARSRSDDLLLSVQLSGVAELCQDGREARLAPGDFALYDTQRDYALTVHANTRQLVLKMPRRALQSRFGPLAHYTARRIGHDQPLGGMASEFLKMLPARIGMLDPAAERQLADQALDLVALGVTRDTTAGMGTATAARLAALLNLKSVIETRLTDTSLRPSGAAAAAGISIRYANTLLADEETSLERYIWARRLERSRKALQDARQMRRSVSDIAYSCGFSSPSHFARRFKEAYGVSPNEFRRCYPTVCPVLTTTR